MAGNHIRNSLEMIPDRGEVKNTQLCILHVGNPPVPMRRPAIFNLETGPVFEWQESYTPVPAWLKQKIVGNNEERTMRNTLSVAAFTHVNTETPGFMGVWFFFKNYCFRLRMCVWCTFVKCASVSGRQK